MPPVPPSDLDPERLPWSAILAGALAGFAPLGLLVALGASLGLLAPVAELGAGGLVFVAAAAFVALFVAGFTTARVSGATTRRRGALYGLLSSSMLAAFCAWLLAGGLAGCASFTSTSVVRPVLGPGPPSDTAPEAPTAETGEEQPQADAASPSSGATPPGGVPPGEVPPFAAVPPPLIPEIAPPTLPPAADGEEPVAPPVPPIPPPPPTDVVPAVEERADEAPPAASDAGDEPTRPTPAEPDATPVEPSPEDDPSPTPDEAGARAAPPAALRPVLASATAPAIDAGAASPPAREAGADARRLGLAWLVGLLGGLSGAALGGGLGLARPRDGRGQESSVRREPARPEPVAAPSP